MTSQQSLRVLERVDWRQACHSSSSTRERGRAGLSASRARTEEGLKLPTSQRFTVRRALPASQTFVVILQRRRLSSRTVYVDESLVRAVDGSGHTRLFHRSFADGRRRQTVRPRAAQDAQNIVLLRGYSVRPNYLRQTTLRHPLCAPTEPVPVVLETGKPRALGGRHGVSLSISTDVERKSCRSRPAGGKRHDSGAFTNLYFVDLSDLGWPFYRRLGIKSTFTLDLGRIFAIRRFAPISLFLLCLRRRW